MNKPTLVLVVSTLVFTAIPALAQQQQAPPAVQQQTPQAAPQPAPATTQGPPSDGKIRIYVTDSQSWEVTGGWGAAHGSGGGGTSGGARPQTAETIKTFNQRCPQYTVTNQRVDTTSEQNCRIQSGWRCHFQQFHAGAWQLRKRCLCGNYEGPR